MSEKEFSKTDVSIAKQDETFDANQLEGISGGTSAEAAASCTCDCFIGNSNNAGKKQTTFESDGE